MRSNPISRDAQILAIKLGRLAMTLPEGVGLVTHDDRPIHPIFDGAGRIVKWLIYFRLVGQSQIQPPSAPVAGAPEGIIDLGEGWKVLKVIVHEIEIGNQRQVMERIEKLLRELHTAPGSSLKEASEAVPATSQAEAQQTASFPNRSHLQAQPAKAQES